MKKVGFVDYFLSEWHANNYPEWLKKASGGELVVSYAWGELDVSPYDNVTSTEWCTKYNVEKCASIQEVCEKSDYIIVLSPDNPERHLDYAKAVLPYKKPTYIDKTFATDLITAKKIFEIAEKHNTPMFSTSALRCAAELESFTLPVHSVVVTGGGATIQRYGVHQVEMIVKLMGTNTKRVMSTLNGVSKSAVIEFEGGRFAQLNFSPDYGFSVTVQKSADSLDASYAPINSDMFGNLMKKMSEFFSSGKPYVEKAQTLAVMSILDAVFMSINNPFKWVEVQK